MQICDALVRLHLGKYFLRTLHVQHVYSVTCRLVSTLRGKHVNIYINPTHDLFFKGLIFNIYVL